MVIKFPHELFLAATLALFVGKLAGILNISYWVVVIPILAWIILPYATIVLFIVAYLVFVIVKFVMLLLVLGGVWLVAMSQEVVDRLNPNSFHSKMRKRAKEIKRLDNEALKLFNKAGVK